MKQLIIILLVLCACSPLTKQQKTENKVARKIEKLKQKYPQAWDSVNIVTLRIDTVIKEITLEGTTIIDTFKVTEILKEYQLDTVEIPTFITRFLEATRDTVQIDSLDIHLWIAGSGVTFRLQRDSTWIKKEVSVETITITKTEVIRKRFYQDWLFWLLVVIVAVLYTLTKLGKITIKIPRL